MPRKQFGQIFAAGPGAGIALITASVFLLSLSDALVKLSGVRFGLAQLIFLRSFVAALLLGLGISLFARGVRLRPRHAGWVTARSLCLVAMWFCYYASLPKLPLSLAAACYYTAPLLMALMARLLLGEPVGVVRWCAIVLALAGVVVSVNPAAGAVLVLCAVAVACGCFLCARGDSHLEQMPWRGAFAMAFNLNLSLAVAGLWPWSVCLSFLQLRGWFHADGMASSSYGRLGHDCAARCFSGCDHHRCCCRLSGCAGATGRPF
nr:DMT family transporter [Marinicella sp. W31]MDC2875766.1 DMT family transporter [Marinicella sp. W31]